MLLSFGLILFVGMFAGWACKKVKLPSLLGMILTGILLGPFALDFIDESILMISPELRKIALIIILIRAGLGLNVKELKKVGRPAFLMCFLPATLEILGMIVFAPMILGVSILEAAILGAVVAAVSPAVIVPKMLQLMERGYGTKKSIPQMILAGAALDDVYVIVIFTAVVGLAQGESIFLLNFLNIPVSIGLGIVLGIIVGQLMGNVFRRFPMRDTIKVMGILGTAFVLVSLEDLMATALTFSALITIMVMGMTLKNREEILAERLSLKFSKLWVGAELILFVLVGATVNLEYVVQAGGMAILLILIVLLFRMIGVFLSLVGTNLSKKERLFCGFGYLPKATVQAAIGGIPLAYGLACGETVLMVAVLAILISAPLGALLIDTTHKKLLKKE